jgi:hypothetical protein
MDKDTAELLRNYIRLGGPTTRQSEVLIFGINRHRAWQIVKECAERANLPKLVNTETGRIRNISPHRLRDAFAVHAVKLDDSGDGLRLLQEHLGHASFNTTAKYRKISVRKAMERGDSVDRLPLRPARGGFLRPFGCGWFIREFLLGHGPEDSPKIDPSIGAPQADIFFYYKKALLRAIAVDRATRQEERDARRGKRSISPERIERLTERCLLRTPYKVTGLGGWKKAVKRRVQLSRTIILQAILASISG